MYVSTKIPLEKNSSLRKIQSPKSFSSNLPALKLKSEKTERGGGEGGVVVVMVITFQSQNSFSSVFAIVNTVLSKTFVI